MTDRPIFNAKLEEGVRYFEQMLKVMPDDRTTLEFLAVVYPQMGETEKAEHALAELARVLLKEGDLESATALVERLEGCGGGEAKAMAVRIRASQVPKPELVPESAAPQPAPEEPSDAAAGRFAEACGREAELAEKLGEPEAAAHLRGLRDSGREYLVSALSVLEKEKPEVCEQALARLADEYALLPVPLDVFELDRRLVEKLDTFTVKVRGVVPFAKLGDLTLVAMLSPHDAELRRRTAGAFDGRIRFYLAEPRHVEAAIAKLWPNE